jgi:hypothetical protein
MMEHTTHSLPVRNAAAIHAVSEQPLAQTAVYLADLQTRSNEPDMSERNKSKLNPPFHGDPAAEIEGQQLVETTLPQVEAGVGEFVSTVYAVGSVRFSDHIVEMESLKKGNKYIYYIHMYFQYPLLFFL